MIVPGRPKEELKALFCVTQIERQTLYGVLTGNGRSRSTTGKRRLWHPFSCFDEVAFEKRDGQKWNLMDVLD